MMVSGVPSMHICLDFIPELLAQPQTEKQVYVPMDELLLHLLTVSSPPAIWSPVSSTRY